MKITAATINRELKRLGVAERIKQGRGYVYFTDGASHEWFSSSIAVCYVSDLVVPVLDASGRWTGAGNLAATVTKVLHLRDTLRGDNKP